MVKASLRDLAVAAVKGLSAGTTVAATAYLAHRAGVQVFSTGGLGGVHRGAQQTFDESADLGTLATLPLVVVSAGVKSILDIPLTLERLETLNLAVVGYRTTDYPGFYIADSGHDIEYAVDSPAEIAKIARTRDALGVTSTLLVANPVAPDHELPPEVHDEVLARALAAAAEQGIGGHDTTPFLLDFIQRETGGRSLDVNVDVYRGNVELGARIALALAARLMLVVIGDLVADLIVLGGSNLERGTDNPAEVRLTRGGSAANVAVAAASLRHPVRFIGRVGDDTLGRTLVRELEEAGVEAQVQREGRTGAIVVLVDAVGERTMITDRGAAAELGPIDPRWLVDAEWVHVPLYGFAAPASRAALLEAARGLADGGESGSASTCRASRRCATSVATRSRRSSPPCVPPSSSRTPTRRRSPQSSAASPRSTGIYVVKRGGDAVIVHHAGGRWKVPVERARDVLDSTGAGDAFAAGYIGAAMGGRTALESARAGSALAMSALRRAGAL